MQLKRILRHLRTECVPQLEAWHNGYKNGGRAALIERSRGAQGEIS
jgi:hypothetical protein